MMRNECTRHYKEKSGHCVFMQRLFSWWIYIVLMLFERTSIAQRRCIFINAFVKG